MSSWPVVVARILDGALEAARVNGYRGSYSVHLVPGKEYVIAIRVPIEETVCSRSVGER